MPNRYTESGQKICSKCLISKDKSDFYNRSDKPHLLSSRCIECVRIDCIDSANRHKERHSAKQAEYHQKNRIKRNEYNSQYNKNHRADRRKADAIRRKNDPQFRLGCLLRTRVRLAIKRGTNSESIQELIGCNISFYTSYLHSLFKDGMSWSNFGAWQIDHRKPCNSFDLTIKEQQLKCFHYTNTQPLWALDNRLKSYKEKEVCHR